MPNGYTKSGLLGALVAAVLALPDPAAAQVLPNLQDPLQRPLDELGRSRERLEERARRRAATAADATEATAGQGIDPVGDTVQDSTEGAVEAGAAALQTAGQSVDEVAGIAAQAIDDAADTAARPLREFTLGASPDGWPVEARTVVALMDDDELAGLAGSGLDIVARRSLPGLGRTLVTFREPTGAPVQTTLDTVRTSFPGATADYNHVYRLQSAGTSVDGRSPEAAGAESDVELFDIGLIDSAVDAGHFSLRGAALSSASFVDHEGTEPVNHGTAVASLLHDAADGRARIHSASVFFQAPNYAPGATTESLVAALDWLATNNVRVINMSLAGPANSLLEAAIRSLQADDSIIVAAVGNNGPGGEPMYPAAYDGVIGVTAVGRDRRIFRYANRGDFVDFAALGVDVKVADAGAGWRIESGTSMASPIVAVLAAELRQQQAMAADEIVSRLSDGAEDLGPAGQDPVFGHGLVGRRPLLVSRQ